MHVHAREMYVHACLLGMLCNVHVYMYMCVCMYAQHTHVHACAHTLNLYGENAVASTPHPYLSLS